MANWIAVTVLVCIICISVFVSGCTSGLPERIPIIADYYKSVKYWFQRVTVRQQEKPVSDSAIYLEFALKLVHPLQIAALIFSQFAKIRRLKSYSRLQNGYREPQKRIQSDSQRTLSNSIFCAILYIPFNFVRFSHAIRRENRLLVTNKPTAESRKKKTAKSRNTRIRRLSNINTQMNSAAF